MLTAALAVVLGADVAGISETAVTLIAAVIGILGGWAGKAIWTSSRAQSTIALQDSVINTMQVDLNLKDEQIKNLMTQMAEQQKRLDGLTAIVTQKAEVARLSQDLVGYHEAVLKAIETVPERIAAAMKAT